MTSMHTLFTWTAQKDFAPFPLAGGEGAWFWDASGRRVLDMASVVVNANAGHNHPRILDAMRRQLETLAVADTKEQRRSRSKRKRGEGYFG